MIHTFKLSLALLVVGLVASCGTPAATPQPATTPVGPNPAVLQVVATFSILGDLVQQVGGEHIHLKTLVGPGGDTHTFEPTPLDAATLADAQLVFENGLAFEGWIDKLFAASGSTATRVVVSTGVTPLHADGELDPHIWHSVPNAIRMVERIRDALIIADTANADAYRANAAAYVPQLNALEAWVQAQVATLPANQRKLVTSHDTFGYYAQQYGFAIIGTVLGVSTEASDPAAAEVVRLIEVIKTTGVKAIFAENVSNTALIERISSETGAKLGPPLYTDALGDPGSAGDSYITMIRYNTMAIVNALKG